VTTLVKLKNTGTGEIKSIKVGWSWTLLLFSNFVGIPLFMRKLYAWAWLYFILEILYFVLRTSDSLSSPTLNPVRSLIWLAMIGGDIFLAIKGNEITGKHYLKNGWVFADPDSDSARVAEAKWAK
jgi:hypothetical protein